MSDAHNILITGAGGFLGQALAAALMRDASVSSLVLTDVTQPSVPSIADQVSCEVQARAADLTDKRACHELLQTAAFTHVYLLHGIMSGAAEANYALGMRVNLDSMRNVTDVLLAKEQQQRPRVVFPSSLAVFGPQAPGSVTSEATMPSPQSSYGAQKFMVETLLNDLARRGALDARIVRLPTIIVRPGAPSGAASSFCSGIIREPLKGQRAPLPVKRNLELWVSSTRTVVQNLLFARTIPETAFAGKSRVTNLPGITVTVQQMLNALLEVGGEKALNLVEDIPDDGVEKIVASWPAHFDVSRAKQLGFQDDHSLKETIKEYIEDYSQPS